MALSANPRTVQAYGGGRDVASATPAAGVATAPPVPVKIKAVPRERWPPWAEDLALKAAPGDGGLGSVIEHEIGDFESVAFALWYQKTFPGQKRCESHLKCPGLFNQRYPLR